MGDFNLWTAMEAASGSNGAGMWMAALAALVLIHRSWLVRDKRFSYRRNVVDFCGSTYTYLVVGVGLALYACRSALWEPYYNLMAAAPRRPDVLSVAKAYQEWARAPAAVFTAMTALNAALHLRFWLHEIFGRAWFVAGLVIAFVFFVVHAALPWSDWYTSALAMLARWISGG